MAASEDGAGTRLLGLITALPGAVVAFVRQNGWYFLFAAAVYFLVRDRIAAHYMRYSEAHRKKKDDIEIDSAELAKLRSVRMRQQEIHMQKAAKAAEEKALLEAEKKERMLDEYDKMQGKTSGFRLGDGKADPKPAPADSKRQSSKPKPRFRPTSDSMPLAGYGGGSSGFKSSRSNPRGGG